MSTSAVYRLRIGTRWRDAGDGMLVIFLRGNASPVRVANPLRPLLEILHDGATAEEVTVRLRQTYGTPVEENQVKSLLNRLESFDVIENGKPLEGNATSWPIDIGLLVDRYQLGRLRIAIALFALAATVGATLALGIAFARGSLRNPVTAAFHLDWIPFAAMFGLMLLHEIGHALAAIASKIPLGRLGVTRKRLFLLRSFVETIPRAGAMTRRQNIIVAAGGPLMDYSSAGAAAAISLVTQGRTALTFSVIAPIALLICLRNLSPGPPNDGFKILCGLFQKNARPSQSHNIAGFTVRTYRSIYLTYNFGFIVIVVALLYFALRKGVGT